MLSQVAFHRASVESESTFEFRLPPTRFRAGKHHPMHGLVIVIVV